MIDLDFQPDDETVRADLESSPETADPAVVEETYFVLPVRFAIDGVELIAYPGVHARWRPLPLIGFATHLHEAVETLVLGETKTCSLADGGYLALRLHDHAISLMPSLLKGVSVSVSKVELAGATKMFRSRVRAFLLSKAPTLAKHPSWATWFRE